MEEEKFERHLDLFKEEIALIIPKIVEIEEGGFVMVNRVSFEQRMKLIHVFVMIFPESHENVILSQLKAKRFDILKQLQKRFPHRRIPTKLLFDLDTQAKYAREVDEILDTI